MHRPKRRAGHAWHLFRVRRVRRALLHCHRRPCGRRRRERLHRRPRVRAEQRRQRVLDLRSCRRILLRHRRQRHLFHWAHLLGPKPRCKYPRSLRPAGHRWWRSDGRSTRERLAPSRARALRTLSAAVSRASRAPACPTLCGQRSSTMGYSNRTGLPFRRLAPALRRSPGAAGSSSLDVDHRKVGARRRNRQPHQHAAPPGRSGT